MSSGTPLLPFAQLDVPGRAAIADGRFLIREAPDADPAHVLIVRTLGAVRNASRGRRRGKPQPADPGEQAALPLGRYTVARPKPFADGDAAEAWLKATAADSERTAAMLEDTAVMINRAIHAQRVASGDPGIADVSADAAAIRRVGYGSGDELADGRWTGAVELPRPEPRGLRARLADVGPQEQVAAALGAKAEIPPAHALVMRARSDLTQSREREAALQLIIGIDAILAGVDAGSNERQTESLGELQAQRDAIAAIASNALRGPLGPEESGALSDALAVAERILRRTQLG